MDFYTSMDDDVVLSCQTGHVTYKKIMSNRAGNLPIVHISLRMVKVPLQNGDKRYIQITIKWVLKIHAFRQN